MAGKGQNGKLIIDIVTELQAEFKKFRTDYDKLQNDIGKNGIEVPVEGKFDEFKQQFRSAKVELEKTPVYVDVRINEEKFRKELDKIENSVRSLQTKLNQTPMELKLSLGKDLFSGIENKLSNIMETVNDVSKSLRSSGQLEIVSDRELKKIQSAKKELDSVLSINKSAFKVGDTDAFYNKAMKQLKNLAKYRSEFFTSFPIATILNGKDAQGSIGANGLDKALKMILNDLSKAENITTELNKSIQFGDTKEDIISVREVLTLLTNELENYENVANSLRGTNFTAAMFEEIKKLLNASEEYERVQKELVSAQEREIFKKDQIQKIEDVTKAFAGLDDLVGKLSGSLQAVSSASSSAGGTPFQFDKQQLEAITGTFKELNSVLKELSDTLKNGINLGQFAEGTKKISDTVKSIKDTSKQSSGQSKLFLDPKKDADEYEKAAKAANKFKKQLGEIQKISRIGKGNTASYEVIGKTGRVNLIQDQNGKLIADRTKQEIQNNAKLQKEADEAQLRRLSEIEKRKEQIRKLEKEIFDQERKLNQMVNDKADSNAIAQQKEVIKEKKAARHVAYNYIRRGMGGSDSGEYKSFVEEINKANAAREREIQISKEATRAAKAEATAKKQAVQEAKKNQREAEKANTPLSKKDEVKLQKLVNDVNKFKEELDEIKGNTAFDSIKEDVDSLDSSIDELVNDLGKVTTKSGLENVTNAFNSIKQSSKGVRDRSSIEKNIRNVIDKNLVPLTNSDKYTSSFVQNVKGAISGLEKELADSAGDVDKLSEAFKEASEQAEKFGEQAKQSTKGNASTIENLRLKIAKFLSENTKLGGNLRRELGNLRIHLDGAELTDEQLKQIISDFNRIQTEAYETGQVGKSAFDTLRGRIKQMSTNFIAMYFSLYDIIRYSKELFNATKEFDTALTEMRKVSDETVTTLKSFQAESFGTADAVGTTALALQKSTADWMRLGESIEEAKKSAETTTVLLNVSEFENVDEATKAMVSASQAYNDLEKLDIVDKLNIIGKLLPKHTAMYGTV